MTSPREVAQRVERGVQSAPGMYERFSGYGLMGLPFTTGHILGLRCFPSSSVGAGYKSVWHRNPKGEWTFYQDVAPRFSCPRYFGNALVRAYQVSEILVTWPSTHEFAVSIAGEHALHWKVTLTSTPATRLLNSMARMMPDPLWRNGGVLRLMGAMGGKMLGAGRLGLVGKAPNGQEFMANPRQIWVVASSSATVEGEDVGVAGPLQIQANLGDFWIPQRGIFVIGSALFEPYDSLRHWSKIAWQDAGE